MAVRPYDWSPLAESDPVPGDPPGIRSEAARLSGVAKLIQDQVAVLRKIATGQGDEQGQHVEKLRSAASDTADKLGQVAGRYEQTASALTAWAPELEYAQSQSLKALTAAQEAASRQRANQPVHRPPGAHVSDADKQADHAHATALQQANSDLAAAHTVLDGAMSHRDTAAAETKSKIESAIDDGVVDGFWDHVSNWIHEHAGILSDIATVLEWVATALAVVALFVSGAWIVIALAAVIGGALLLRTVLAANGDGSWSDVAMDAFALATLGVGTGAGFALGKLAGGAADTAKGFVQGERTLQEFGAVSKLSDAPGGEALLTEGTPGEALDNALKPFEKPSLAQKLLGGGDAEKAASIAKLDHVTNLFKNSPVMQGISRQAAPLKVAARGSFLAGTGADLADKIGGGVKAYGDGPAEHPAFQVGGPWSEGYNAWKESWTPESSVWPTG